MTIEIRTTNSTFILKDALVLKKPETQINLNVFNLHTYLCAWRTRTFLSTSPLLANERLDVCFQHIRPIFVGISPY